MRRVAVLSLVLVAVAGSGARGFVLMMIEDPVDDTALVSAVAGQQPVKQLGTEIVARQRAIGSQKLDRIEKLLGPLAAKRAKDYAMPVAQSRKWALSGIGFPDPELNKHHTEFYPVGDFAGIEVWYGIDGKTPQLVLLYFKVDDAFPKLKRVADKYAGPPVKVVPVRQNAIDLYHWHKIKQGMNKKDVAEVLSVPPGDYAPGMEHLSEPYGRQSTDGRKASETLEWCGEKGRVSVEFDAKGLLVTSEFCYPGHDPATNIAERLKWDRAKFERVKKYIENRMAAK